VKLVNYIEVAGTPFVITKFDDDKVVLSFNHKDVDSKDIHSSISSTETRLQLSPHGLDMLYAAVEGC